MRSDPFALYDALADGVKSEEPVVETAGGRYWAMAATADGMGLGMMTPGESIPPAHPDGLTGLPLREAARAVSSWNLREASFGLAAANAWYNNTARMMQLGSYEPFKHYPTVGLDLEGMTVGLVGHMHGPAEMWEKARKVYIVEREPKPGDYPDAACDWLLPQCDLVLITGSSLINKTLPHLLTLCENAFTILLGPSVPMCPALLDFGIDRLAGLVVTEHEAMAAHVRESRGGSPYYCGRSFLIR